MSLLRSARFVVALVAGAVLALGVGASDARPTPGSGHVTISMLTIATQQPGLDSLIQNFERVDQNVSVDVTYAASITLLYQLEATELAAGDGPDLLTTFPGCGSPVAVCALAKSGELAPMVKAPWVKRSLPLVTSLSKDGHALLAFETLVSPEGIFTNDALFKQLGLSVPQTFPQLLDICAKAKAAGTAAVILAGASGGNTSWLIEALSIPTVYAKDPQFTAEQKVGNKTFDGSPGWHQAQQELVEMNDAGCFQPGATGTTAASGYAQFAQGQGLMLPGISAFKAAIDAAAPQFTYSFDPFPGGANPKLTTTFLNLSPSVSVNAHSSAQNQAAAQSFVDFIARPEQNALYAQIQGGLTQYEFLKGQLPTFMAGFAPLFKSHEYVLNPTQTWWNANVLLTLLQDEIGLITGQLSIDDVLKAMDTAWQQGTS
jgi:raffinose/stachyose/melibiose transport system substrate-binding protein